MLKNSHWLRPYIAVLSITTALIAMDPSVASAHRSGCHRWNSCESDSGSYVCGDTGHASQCGGSSSAPVVPLDRKVATLVIKGPTTVEPLDLVEFAVDAKNGAGEAIHAYPTWSAIGGSRSGVWLAPTKAGTYTVTATADGITATLDITVVPGRPRSASLEADSTVITVGRPLTIRSVVNDRYDNPIPNLDSKWSVWGVGQVRNGVFTASEPGHARVTAVVGGLTAYLSIEVEPAVVTKVIISPATASVEADKSVQFVASAFDEQNHAVTAPEIAWSATGGTITAGGLFTGGANSVAGEVRATVMTPHGPVVGTASVGISGSVKTEIQSGTPGATAADASSVIESTLAGDLAHRSPAELDVLADAQTRLGKKLDALKTRRARLLAGTPTRSAYAALLSLEAEVGERQEMDTYVRGRKVSFDVRPVVREGRTLLPVRAIAEALGATVTWDGQAQAVTIRKDATTLQLTVGSTQAQVNGKPAMLDVPAQVENGRTLLPARFVAEQLGLQVNWFASERVIVITEAPLQ